jgi:hypothetical protein
LNKKGTLGYHRDAAMEVFGPGKAVDFLDNQIKKSPQGRDTKVGISEDQLFALLGVLHVGDME